MKLVASKDTSRNKLRSSLRRFGRVYLAGGFVGLVYAVRLAHLKDRTAAVNEMIQRERDLHADNLRSLNYEFRQLVDARQRVSQAASEHWKQLGVNAKELA